MSKAAPDVRAIPCLKNVFARIPLATTPIPLNENTENGIKGNRSPKQYGTPLEKT